MAINVYPAEQRVYFGNETCVYRGYYITTSGDSVTVTHAHDSWQVCEEVASQVFGGDMLIAAFLLLRWVGSDDWQAWAELQILSRYPNLTEEMANVLEDMDFAMSLRSSDSSP